MNQRALYECLLRVKSDPGMAPLREWLQISLSASHNLLVTLNNDFFRIEQGKAQKVKELLDLIEQSNKLLEQEMKRK